MLLNRILVSIIAIPLLLFIVMCGEISSFVVLEASIVIMMNEFYSMLKRNKVKVSAKTGIVIGILIPLICHFSGKSYPDSISLLLASSVILFITRRVSQESIRESIDSISYTLFGILYIPYLFNYALLLRMEFGSAITFLGINITNGRFWLLVMFGISFGSDIASFAAGKLFGRNRLTTISPNKTIEGLIGAVLFGFALGLYLNRIIDISIYKSLALTVIGVILAQLGDLGSSLFKREFGIKDYSSIMMSHGGLLDRCDSVLFTAPFVFYFVKFLI